jgi:hypothetical protein
MKIQDVTVHSGNVIHMIYRPTLGQKEINKIISGQKKSSVMDQHEQACKQMLL